MKRAQHGITLIELLVALGISSLIVLGATTVYMRSRTTHEQNEGIARLQETARYAMSIMEPDVRAADYWGLLKGGWQVQNKADAELATPLSPAAPNAPTNACGRNFAVDIDTPVWGDNNAYVISDPYRGNLTDGTRTAACDSLPRSAAALPQVAWNTSAVASSDTLTIRRAAVCNPDPNNDGNGADSTCPAPTAGVLQICSARNGGSLISNGAACATWPNGQLGNVVTNVYYVDNNSEGAAGVPSLRRKSLTSAGGVPQFEDQEIISGVEDLQVQFGIQPNFTANPFNSNALATRYVNPGDAALVGAQIVAVRVWLLVRADTPEAGFADATVYQYADRLQTAGVTGTLNSVAAAGRAFQPAAAGGAGATAPQRFRRLLISRTMQLRNATGT